MSLNFLETNGYAFKRFFITISISLHGVEVLSLCMTYHRICNMRGTIGKAGTSYFEFTPFIMLVKLIFCRPLYVRFSFDCIVCSSSTYSLWLFPWYLQTFTGSNKNYLYAVFMLHYHNKMYGPCLNVISMLAASHVLCLLSFMADSHIDLHNWAPS